MKTAVILVLALLAPLTGCVIGHEPSQSANRLEGPWWIDLRVLDPGTLGHTRPKSTASGRIVFDSRLPHELGFMASSRDSAGYEFGRHMVDLTPVLGGLYGHSGSTSVMGSGSALLFEVLGRAEPSDSTSLVIIPRMSHGGLSLRGRLYGDSIAGVWGENAYCCGASGTFIMRRLRRTTSDDSLVVEAIRQIAAEAATSADARAAVLRRAGFYRLKAYDIGAGRYIDAGFLISRLAPAESGYYSAIVESGDGTWSGYRDLEPGQYRLELSTYTCGIGSVMLNFRAPPDLLPHQQLLISTGDSVSVDFRFDSRATAAVALAPLRNLRCR